MARRGGEQFNININKIWDMLSSLKLMGKRKEMESGLIEQRMTGYQELEEERHANRMAQIQEILMNNLARDPAVERITGLIFKKRVKGEEVPDSLLQDLKKVTKERSMIAYYTYTGTVPPPDKEYLFDNISESAVVDLAGQGATTARARMAKEAAEEALKVRGYEAVTGRIEAETKALKESREWQDMTKEDVEKQRTRWIDMVKDTINFLEAEGVKGDPQQADIKALFSSGKITDPLSSENRGQAFTYLAEIWSKLIQRKKLTPGDIIFLLRVRNSRAIETPIEEGGFGGLPIPEKGGQSQAQITVGMIEQIANDIQARSKVDRQTALQLAKEFYGSKIK